MKKRIRRSHDRAAIENLVNAVAKAKPALTRLIKLAEALERAKK